MISTSKEDFRRELAGLVENHEKSNIDKENISNEIIRYCVILAKYFGSELDRKTLWGKIESAIKSAVAKSKLGDIENFVALSMKSVCADTAKVAASEEMSSWLNSIYTKDEKYKSELMQSISVKSMIYVIRARAKWEAVKEGRKEI